MRARHWGLILALLVADTAQAKISITDFDKDGEETPVHSKTMLLYIAGAVNGIDSFNEMLKAQGMQPVFCIPQNLDIGPQLGISVLSGSLRRHPTIDQNTEIASVLPFALKETFPCN